MRAGATAPAFDLIYHQHAAAVRRLGISMLRDREAAEDLVQESFLHAWRDRARYRAERASMRTWLLAIARNRAIDMLRAQARDARALEATESLWRTVDGPPDALGETIVRDEVARLLTAFAKLPARQRRAVALAYGGGLTHEEVAERIGEPLGTVKSRIHGAQEQLARRLEPGRRPTRAAG